MSVKITHNSLHLRNSQSLDELVSSLHNKMDTKISLYYHTVGRLSQSGSSDPVWHHGWVVSDGFPALV